MVLDSYRTNKNIFEFQELNGFITRENSLACGFAAGCHHAPAPSLLRQSGQVTKAESRLYRKSKTMATSDR